MPERTLLEVKNLRVRFDTPEGEIPAVRGISFALQRGETVGLVGESGSGKTASALALLRLLPEPAGRIESGQILFDGKDLLQLPHEEMRRIRGNRIAMVFQDPMSSLNPYLSIERQMAEVLETHRGLTRREARGRCIEALQRVGFPNPESRIDVYPHQLSGGQRQRVLLATALLCDPEILIADEPTTALDVTIQAQILDLLCDLQRERGLAILLITHDLGVVAEMARKTIVLYAGQIAEEGPTAELFRRPRHPYTAGLLRSLPRIRSEERLLAIPGQPPDLSKLGPGCAFAPRCEWKLTRCDEEAPPVISVGERHASACFEAEKL